MHLRQYSILLIRSDFVNKENVIKSGLVKEKDSDLILDYIDIDLPESIITKIK